MLFPVLSFFFILLLFLNAFSVDFAHDLLDKMIFHPTNIFTALILPIALLSTLIQFLARKDKKLEQTFGQALCSDKSYLLMAGRWSLINAPNEYYYSCRFYEKGINDFQPRLVSPQAALVVTCLCLRLLFPILNQCIKGRSIFIQPRFINGSPY